MKTKIFLIALVLDIVSSSVVTAGTLHFETRVPTAYDSSFNPVLLIPDVSQPQPPDLIWGVEVFVQVSDLVLSEVALAVIGMNINLSSGLTDVYGWSPSFESDPIHTASVWQTNLDAGLGGDLKGILIAIPGGLSGSDPRMQLGQETSVFLGTVYVGWDGVTKSVFSINNVEWVAADENGYFLPSSVASGTELRFGLVPEPSSFVLLGVVLVGFIGFIRCKRS